MDRPADPVALTVGITPPHTCRLLLPQHPSSCVPTSRGWCWQEPWHGPALRNPSHGCVHPWKRPGGWVQPWERRPGWPHCCPPSTASAPLLPPLHQGPPPGSALGLAVLSGARSWGWEARLASNYPRPGCIAPTPQGEPGTQCVWKRQPCGAETGNPPHPEASDLGELCRIVTPAPDSPGHWRHAGDGSPDSLGRGSRNGKHKASWEPPGWASPRTT